MDASMYADPLAKDCVANNLDIMILSATEIDVNFNITFLQHQRRDNGCFGRTSRYCGGCKACDSCCATHKERIPIIVDEVINISTPGGQRGCGCYRVWNCSQS